jgi:selenocysteine lyase/cysteine desulfurase
VRSETAERLDSPWPGYMTLEEPDAALSSPPAPGARRFDMGVVPAPISAWCNTAFDVFAAQGWDAVHARATGLAAQLADLLRDVGHTVAPRGETTLVSWESSDPEGAVARLAEAGILVRYLPGRGLVRASIGAWATEDDLHRLVTAL